MKKYIVLYISFLLFISSAFSAEDFYSLSAVKINGDTLKFSELKGKILMIVNTASLCGYTYQYGELQQLYNQYGGDNFEIIGFPANNFGNQEPGSNEDIEDFCKENYGVTFTMMQKISVLGSNMHPVYQWLTKKSKNGVLESTVQWNFQKYLINADGTYHAVIGTQTSPLAKTIVDWINEPVSVIDYNFNSDIQINYSENRIIILFGDDAIDDYTIEVFDIIGNKIIENYLSDVSGKDLVVDAGDLLNGKYFVTIKSGNKFSRGSFMVVN